MRSQLDLACDATLGKEFMKKLRTAVIRAQQLHLHNPTAQREAVETAARTVLQQQATAIFGNLKAKMTLTAKEQTVELRRRVCKGTGVLGFGNSLVHTVFKQVKNVALDKEPTPETKFQSGQKKVHVQSQQVQTILLMEAVQVRSTHDWHSLIA